MSNFKIKQSTVNHPLIGKMARIRSKNAAHFAWTSMHPMQRYMIQIRRRDGLQITDSDND